MTSEEEKTAASLKILCAQEQVRKVRKVRIELPVTKAILVDLGIDKELLAIIDQGLETLEYELVRITHSNKY